MARVWHLASRPQGKASAENFRLVEQADAPLAADEVRVRNRLLSVEPAMRALMTDIAGSEHTLKLDQPIWGRAVGEVVESRAAWLAVGDLVFHYLGWRDEAVGPASAFEKLPPDPGIPDEYWLSVLGMPGVTAYFGLTEFGKPKAGETLFVSAAAGSVGSNVVQFAKALGLRVIGSAGGADKCAVLRDIGADAVVDYKQGDIAGQLKAAAPDGIDIYFDNVGGDHLDAALGNARSHARFVICGMIDIYNVDDAGKKASFANMMKLVSSEINVRGFIVHEFEHRIAEVRSIVAEWLRQGKIKPLLSIENGLEQTPETFLGLFAGRNTGKAMVRL